MPAPIILISNQRIKPGKLDTYRSNYAGAVERFEQTRPQTLLHSAYLGPQADEVSVVMAFQHADAMETHMRGLGASPQRAQESMDFLSVQIFGSPNTATLAIIKEMVGPGVPVTINAEPIAGYFRGGSI
jgi:hypothetical protein